MDLSIIIVAYKNQEKLRVTLEAVFRSVINYSYEVIVIDNDSRDGTAEMVQAKFPEVKLIKNQNNGFAKANNIGIRQASGVFILLLNPDTAVEPNVLEQCCRLLEQRADIGMVGCKLLKEDGTLDLACRREIPNLANSFFRLVGLSKLFPKSKALSGYNLTYTSEDEEREVGSLSGAFTMTRRGIVDKIGLLDESMFMYGEDIDWCYRCHLAGYKVWYYPKVTTIHYKGQSSSKVANFALYWFHQSMWIFYRKHYAKRYFFLVNWLVWSGVWLRFGLLYVLNMLRKKPYVSR